MPGQELLPVFTDPAKAQRALSHAIGGQHNRQQSSSSSERTDLYSGPSSPSFSLSPAAPGFPGRLGCGFLNFLSRSGSAGTLGRGCLKLLPSLCCCCAPPGAAVRGVVSSALKSEFLMGVAEVQESPILVEWGRGTGRQRGGETQTGWSTKRDGAAEASNIKMLKRAIPRAQQPSCRFKRQLKAGAPLVLWTFLPVVCRSSDNICVIERGGVPVIPLQLYVLDHGPLLLIQPLELLLLLLVLP